jgi:hypothetical protein
VTILAQIERERSTTRRRWRFPPLLDHRPWPASRPRLRRPAAASPPDPQLPDRLRANPDRRGAWRLARGASLRSVARRSDRAGSAGPRLSPTGCHHQAAGDRG